MALVWNILRLKLAEHMRVKPFAAQIRRFVAPAHCAADLPAAPAQTPAEHLRAIAKAEGEQCPARLQNLLSLLHCHLCFPDFVT